MKLYTDNKLIFIIFENKKEEIEIRDFFTYKDVRGAITSAGYNPRKEKKICFIKKIKDKYFLYSGFLLELLKKCKESDIKLTEFVDKRIKLEHFKKEFKDENLAKHFPFNYNSHQISALKKMLKISNGIIKIPTGGGKGEFLAPYIKETGLKTLIVVNRTLLASQLSERLLEHGIDAGVWHSKKKKEGKHAMVATIGSVHTVPGLSTYKVLLIDEVHNASSKSFQDFLVSSNYPIKIGFSATPNKGDKYLFATIRQHMGSIVHEVEAKELIDNKVISLPNIYFINNEVERTIDWPSAYNLCIVDNYNRNKAICDVVNYLNEPTIVLIKDVKNEQGEHIKKAIEENTDKNVVFIHGQSNVDRMEIVKAFDRGEIDVLISTNILNEGVNIKTVRIVVNASGGKSKSENLQKLGRGTRTVRDEHGNILKDEVIIIEFNDLGNRFTEKHSMIRKAIYKKEGFDKIYDIDLNNLEKIFPKK